MIKTLKFEVQTLISNTIRYIWSWYMAFFLFPYHLTRTCIIFVLSKIFPDNYEAPKAVKSPLLDRDEGYNSDDSCDNFDVKYRQRLGSNRLRSQSSPQPLKETLPSKRQLSTKLLLTREVQDFKQKLQTLSLIQLINYYEYIFMMERKQTHSNLDPKALRKILLGAVHRYGSSSVIRDQILWNARGYIYLSPCNLGNPIYLNAPDSNFGLNRIWSRRPLLDYFGSKHSLS